MDFIETQVPREIIWCPLGNIAITGLKLQSGTKHDFESYFHSKNGSLRKDIIQCSVFDALRGYIKMVLEELEKMHRLDLLEQFVHSINQSLSGIKIPFLENQDSKIEIRHYSAEDGCRVILNPWNGKPQLLFAGDFLPG